MKSMVLAASMVLAVASAGQPKVEQFAPQTWFAQDALPQKVQGDTMRNRVSFFFVPGSVFVPSLACSAC